MKKTLLILVAIIGFGFSANAQDIITLKSGEEIKAKVTEISSSEITSTSGLTIWTDLLL